MGKKASGSFPDRDLRSLAVEAGTKALENSHLSPSQIESFSLGNFAGPEFVGQDHVAPFVSTALGINGVHATRTEAACASSRFLPCVDGSGRVTGRVAGDRVKIDDRVVEIEERDGVPFFQKATI